MQPRLPIDDILPDLRRALARVCNVVLHAPPGAGKTTRVPLALLDEDWLDGQRILMLEPRRLAARAAASYMSRLLGDDVGGVVGYRVRLDSRVSARTRIEVVTEGVLTRMLQDDPSLDGVGIVIFDEFHERSLHADLGLALTLQSQSLLRPALRVLVMSATLDVAAVQSLLDDAPVVRSEGRAHRVDTTYLDARIEGHTEPAVASVTTRALQRHDGDVLVFLPGTAEIRRTADLLAQAALPRDTDVLPLYGDLPAQDQDRAIAPSPPGRRKVVLATSIAETSLTIEGVRVVVDSGLMRVPRFSPRTGMTRLATVPVSHAAADQRRGRAGRVGPGICYRLWTEGDHAALLEHRPPEIMEADLAALALELAAWGIGDPAGLRWIDAPPASSFAQARALLRELDALDDDGRITAHGRTLAALALHPRLAHMLQRARELGHGALACELAALLSERDVLRGFDETDPDVRLRLPLLRGSARNPPPHHRIDHGALQRARTETRHWRQRMRITAKADGDDGVGLLLALAYPDRIGVQRGARGRFLLRNGRGASMDARHPLAAEPMIVAAELAGHGRDSRIYLAAPVSQDEVERHFATQVETHQDVAWDVASNGVRARETRRLGAIVLTERPLRDVAPERIAAALLDHVRRSGLDALDWTRDATQLRARLAFLHAHDPAAWPDVRDDALLASLDEWLLPWLDGAGTGALQRMDLKEVLLALVGWERRNRIDELAPTHITVPSGSSIAIDYSDATAPVLAVKLQEMFGLADTPRIAGGAVPLTLHLLSPARRPVQVTRDLASFWRTGYFEARRDLRGRYPKHPWPDDPVHAAPTALTKRHS